MGKEVGSSKLGELYSADKKVFKHREWRGLKDTWYDYTRWLGVIGMLGKFMLHPRNVKGFFRYRWMLSYLAVPMMIDKPYAGSRGTDLRT